MTHTTTDTTSFTDHHHDHTRNCFWDPSQARWACPSPAPERQPESLVDVRDMLVVHTALLREFRLAPAAVARVRSGDRAQADAVGRHLDFLCDLLHHHHSGEDALLWPLLRERSHPSASRLLDDAEGQHHDIDATLTEVRELRVTWAQDPAPGTTELLAGHLDKLHALLAEHLDLEERALLPLAAGTLTVAEWNAIGESAVATMAKPALALAFGMFAYEGDPAVLRAMLAGAPLVPRVLLPRIAPRLYARRAAQVHGTPRP